MDIDLADTYVNTDTGVSPPVTDTGGLGLMNENGFSRHNPAALGLAKGSLRELFKTRQCNDGTPENGKCGANGAEINRRLGEDCDAAAQSCPTQAQVALEQWRDLGGRLGWLPHCNRFGFHFDD